MGFASNNNLNSRIKTKAFPPCSTQNDKKKNNIKAGLFTACPEFLQTAELKSCINLYVRNRENQLVWTNCPLPLSPARIHPSQLALRYQELPSLAQHTSCLWVSYLTPLENTTATSALLDYSLRSLGRQTDHLLTSWKPETQRDICWGLTRVINALHTSKRPMFLSA